MASVTDSVLHSVFRLYLSACIVKNTSSSQLSLGRNVGQIESLDLSGLDQLAVSLVDQLPSGITFGLVGTLGAGKTTLVQAVARACGIDAAEVTSPTFTLLQTHQGKLTLHHLDTYRLADEDEFLELGVDELFEDEDSWTFVEWAERFPSVMPPNTLWICIDLKNDDANNDVGSANNDHRQVTFYCDDAIIKETISDVIQNLAT